jgi:hypothetical protein
MTNNDSNFADFEEGLLMIRARMIIKGVDNKMKHCSSDEVRQALVLKAYYFGKEYPNCPFNPFAKVEHPDQKDLIESFFLGTDGTVSSEQLPLAM